MVKAGFVAGRLDNTPLGFAQPPVQREAAVLDRIRWGWIAVGRAPTISEICWFGLPFPPA